MLDNDSVLKEGSRNISSIAIKSIFSVSRGTTRVDIDYKPGDGGKARLPNPDIGYLRDIVLGITNNASKYEKKIDSILADNWTIDRLDVLMRALLKAASYEFFEKPEIPMTIIISEYTDLSHAFFFDKEAKFACSIINQLATQIRDH